MCKKLLILIIYILLSCPFMLSQRFDGGIVAGFSMSQIDGDGYAGYHQPGLMGGFYTNTELARNLDGQIEIRYTGKGARETGSPDEPMFYQLKLHYIEVPIKLNYRLESYNISLNAGIVPAYLFNHYAEGVDGTMTVVELLDMDPLRKLEISSLIGLSYHLTERMCISMAFNYSLFAIRKYENTDFNYGPIARVIRLTNGDYNNSVQFGMYFQLSRP